MKAHLKAGSMLGTWIVPMDGWYDISVRLGLDAAEEARKDLQAEVNTLRERNEGLVKNLDKVMTNNRQLADKLEATQNSLHAIREVVNNQLEGDSLDEAPRGIAATYGTDAGTNPNYEPVAAPSQPSLPQLSLHEPPPPLSLYEPAPLDWRACFPQDQLDEARRIGEWQENARRLWTPPQNTNSDKLVSLLRVLDESSQGAEGQAAKQSAAAALPFVLNEWADEVFASRDDLATEHKEQAKAIMLGALTNIFVSKDGQAGRMSDWANPKHAAHMRRRTLEHDSFKVIEGLDRTFAAIFGGAGIN